LSKPIETQAEFRQLADERLEEARALLIVKRWGGAYYLAGYAVELALKACIIKTLMMTDAFPVKDFSKDCYTHSVEKLVGLAKLADLRKIATAADPDLSMNWGVVKDWSEEKRYHLIDQSEAEELFNAIADAGHGVLQWIKTQW
jgi:hypothetical protein